MFMEFGWLAAVRNLHRSGLAVASLALATVVLVVALILSQGQPGTAEQSLRAAIGGDIIVTSEVLVIEGITGPSDGHWQLVRRSPDNPGILSYFLPEIVWDGVPGYDSEVELTVEQLKEIPGVVHAKPYRTMPVQMQLGDEVFWMQLRARDHDVDERYDLPGEAVVQGRHLTPDDDGEMVCVFDVHRIHRSQEVDYSYGYHRWNEVRAVMAQGSQSLRYYDPPAVGERLTVLLPDGDDTTGGESLELEVAGHMLFKTGVTRWGIRQLTPAGLEVIDRGEPDEEDDPSRFVSEDIYWPLPEIWVTHETFDRIEERTGGGEWAEPTEFVVGVEDFSRVNTVADQLRDRLSESTVMTVTELSMVSDLLPEPRVAVPTEDIQFVHMSPQAPGRMMFTAPEWFHSMLSVVAVALAALLYLGNLYVITITRSKEMAVLKALGSYNWQLFVAFITEMLVIAGLGTMIGYVLSTPMLVHQWVSNALGFGTIALRLAQGLLTVAGLVLLVSLVVVLIPFVRVARLSPREVIGSE